MMMGNGAEPAQRPPLAGEGERPGRPAPGVGRPGAGRAAGLLMGVAAVTLGVASYLHRDGRIPLGFTVIHGERFYGASIPEAVIAVVLAAGAVAALAAWSRGRAAAVGATTFAIAGVAYGLSVTTGTGRAIDIAYHSALLAVLLATEVILWRRGVVSGSRAAAARG
ncbi:MAG TPA: hypothetical protein VGM79_00430 [Streptosporangiaceae bacterium]|jgi:hypothetical protein